MAAVAVQPYNSGVTLDCRKFFCGADCYQHKCRAELCFSLAPRADVSSWKCQRVLLKSIVSVRTDKPSYKEIYRP